jgi:hypothetical protein
VPLLVLVIHRGDALDRRLVLCWLDGRRDDGKSIGLEREVDLRLAAAVFFQIGFPGRPTVTPVHDDLEIVLRAKRRLESRKEVPAPERIAGDDAQVSRLDCQPDPPPFEIVSPM